MVKVIKNAGLYTALYVSTVALWVTALEIYKTVN